MAGRGELPRWVDVGLIPLINLSLALFVSGIVVLIIGGNPIRAVGLLITGAFGDGQMVPHGEAIGFTLYYTTNYVFTGLAVAIAFHCGLFNIGGEGQAYIGGLGVGLVCLYLDFLPFVLIVPAAIIGGAVFGAAWAFIPAYLQAKRGSHIVITTIMFNFIAAALMVYLMVNILIRPGQQSPESRTFAEHAMLPAFHEILGAIGIEVARSPANLSLIWAIVVCVFVWLFIWRTRWGYAVRTVGQNARAAVYGGISPANTIIMAMLIAGAMAGFLGLNAVMGEHGRLLLNFQLGYGFGGIAVALMGRNHPIGVFLAALLFGILTQGGGELAFEMPQVTREMVVVIQGLVILFAGALEHMFRPRIAAYFLARAERAQAAV